MTGSKIVIIVLVVIVAVFVVLMIWGIGNAGPPSSGDPKKDANTFNSGGHPSFLDSISGWGSGPKLDPKQLEPPTTTFDLARQSTYTVLILPDSDHPFRKARFKVPSQNTCAHVVFQPTKDAPDGLKDPQDSEDSHVHDKNDFSFTVPKAGGTLTISRRFPNNAPCTVVLE